MVTPKIFYQTNEWTCGPSCLMMALSCFDLNYTPNSSDEKRIWENSITKAKKFPYTTHPKLALELIERGYSTELWHNHSSSYQYVPKHDRSSARYWNFHERMALYNRFKLESSSNGMASKVFHFSVEDIVKELTNNKVAMALTKLDGNAMIFHHQLIYSMSNDLFNVACPINGLCEKTKEQLHASLSLPFGKGLLWVWRS